MDISEKVTNLNNPVKLDLSSSSFNYLIDEIGIHELINKSKNKFGDLLELEFGDYGFYFVGDASYIKNIFKQGFRQHRKPLQELVGNGLFARESSQEHLNVRRKLQSIYTVSKIDGLFESISDDMKLIVSESIFKNEISETGCSSKNKMLTITSQQMFKVCKKISIEINVNIMFGQYANNTIRSAIAVILDYIDKHLFARGNVEILESIDKDAFLSAKNDVYKAIENIINVSDDTEFDETKLQGIIEELKNTFVKNDSPDISVINDEVLSLLGSGLETSGAMMFWISYVLASNHDVQDKVRDEVTVASDNIGSLLSHEKQQDSYVNNVVCETLRLYPAAWANFRYIDKDITLGDTIIEKDSLLCVSPYVIHRDERYWENAEEFNPERFNLVSMKERYEKFHFFPFAGGSHRCLAERLAYIELRLFTSILVKKFHLDNPHSFKLQTSPRLSLEPKGNCIFTIRTL